MHVLGRSHSSTKETEMPNQPSSTESELRQSAANGEVSRLEVVRRGLRAGLGLAALAALAATPRSGAARGTGTIPPPNCIYVCCDGTCDSWKMCMKCFTFPKGT